jgi:pyruvate formate lyase activating enzyme
MTPNKGTVFDVQGFSVHDGPGCRTLVFLKGCSLNCGWCANPEGINQNPEIMYYKTSCKANTFSCIESCQKKAITRQKDNTISIDRNQCKSCGTFECKNNCDHDAFRVSGQEISVDEIVEKIDRDRQYWGANGGITLTGGEPLTQPKFASEILKRCYDKYIHTSIETCGMAAWSSFEKVLPYLEWVFFDLKHMDPVKHWEGTGLSNELILENAQRIASDYPDIRLIFRMPIIPGFNDSVVNIQKTADFIKETRVREVNVLPIHYLGLSKYDVLGRSCLFDSMEKVSEDKINQIRKVFQKTGITCYVGSDTPF